MPHKAKSDLSKKAVIYCRVSDVKQKTEGTGLDSQETRCREYASYRNYDIVKVFKDDMSGKHAKRPGMQSMLAFLRKQKHAHIVIIDDISRLARGLDAHLQLRGDIARAGATLESPTVEFGEDSDSMLVENMLASVAQHHRQKNAEQTKNRMRARALNGYWVFWAPVGYTYKATRGEGKVMVRNEPLATLIQNALERFADGRINTVAEFMRHLGNQPEFKATMRTGNNTPQRYHYMLKNPLYAGYIELPNWNVPLCKARHEGLISFEDFQRIQSRMKERAHMPARADIHLDFPLRGAVLCHDCGHPMTSCWSKSRNGTKHPYYFCFKKGCDSYRKSIPRAKLETAVEALIKNL